MEKTINISSTSANTNVAEKLTKTKNDVKHDLKKKAEINAILEKYNLKPSKKTKTNLETTNFEIKPNQNQSNVIHVSKSLPATQINTPLNTPSINPLPTRPVSTTNTNTNTNNSSQIIASSIPNTISNLVKPNIDTLVKNIIDEDKKKELARKNEMPKAIISNKNNSKSNINIYDFIPTVKNDSSSQKISPIILQNKTTNNLVPQQYPNPHPNNNIHKHSVNNIVNNAVSNVASNTKKNEEIKKVSINPNLSAEESQDYKGEPNNSNTQIKVKNILNNTNTQIGGHNKPLVKLSPTSKTYNNFQNNFQNTVDLHARIPSPIRNIMQHQNKLTNQSQSMNPETRNINIQTGNILNGNKQSRISPNQNQIQINQGQTQNNIPELSNLEQQRLLLQKQQMIELQKFKAKKAEIIKLNNRKKEIELMRSIEDEKNKLRKIQVKQHELNNIYNSQIQSQTQSGGTLKNIIYNVDAKKTKKNITIHNNNTSDTSSAEVIDVPRNKKKIIMDANNAKDANNANNANNSKNAKNANNVIDIKVNSELDKELIKKESKMELKIDSSKKESKTESKIDPKKKDSKKEIKIGDPLKYYSKKDKPDIKFPTREILYNTDTFTESLITVLGAPRFFNKKQRQDKTSLEDINKTMQNIYSFKHLDRFKESLITTLYKILSYEKIKWNPE